MLEIEMSVFLIKAVLQMHHRKQKQKLTCTRVKSPLTDNQDKNQDVKKNKQIVSAESGTEIRHCKKHKPYRILHLLFEEFELCFEKIFNSNSE